MWKCFVAGSHVLPKSIDRHTLGAGRSSSVSTSITSVASSLMSPPLLRCPLLYRRRQRQTYTVAGRPYSLATHGAWPPRLRGVVTLLGSGNSIVTKSPTSSGCKKMMLNVNFNDFTISESLFLFSQIKFNFLFFSTKRKQLLEWFLKFPVWPRSWTTVSSIDLTRKVFILISFTSTIASNQIHKWKPY